MKLCAEGEVAGYIAFHSVSNIFFILRKVCSNEHRRELLKKLCKMVTVTGASHKRVVEAIAREDFSDFEDCLQDECAQEVGAEYIVTRNVSDFINSKVKAVSPQEFIKLMEK